jgi:hypothetical protein
MNKIVLISSLSAMVLVLSVSGAQSQDPPDLQEYLQKIRDDGMSEGARMQLHTISAIILGQSILEFHEDDSTGRLWPGYMSASCPNPNSDPTEEAVRQRRLTTELETLVSQLKPIADSDSSGFVSTREGHAFRELVEFGYLAAHVTDTGGATLKVIAKASGLSEGDVDEKLSAYRRLADRMATASIKPLPAVQVQ